MEPCFLKAYLPQRRSDKRMQICGKFVRLLDHRLPKRMILQRNGTAVGGKNWHVNIISLEGHVYIEDGWPKFVRDNQIEDGDMLTFHYIRGLAFRVTVFGKEMCEKQVVSSDDASEDNDDDDSDNVNDDKEDEGDAVAEVVPAFKHKQKARKAGNGGSRSTIPLLDYFPNVDKYIDVRNPFFVTRLKHSKKNSLPVPWHFNSDYNLKLGTIVTFEDPFGRKSKGEIKIWNDGRIWISGWGTVRRRNNIGPEDAIICEFPQSEGTAICVVKIHILSGAGQRMSGPSPDSS